MKDFLSLLKYDLINKEDDLKNRQEYFKVMTEEELNMNTFEKNVIQDLLITNELKIEINQLKHYIMLLENFED